MNVDAPLPYGQTAVDSLIGRGGVYITPEGDASDGSSVFNNAGNEIPLGEVYAPSGKLLGRASLELPDELKLVDPEGDDSYFYLALENYSAIEISDQAGSRYFMADVFIGEAEALYGEAISEIYNKEGVTNPSDWNENTVLNFSGLANLGVGDAASTSISHPSLLWSMVPVVGSGWEAIADFQEGDYLGAAFNTAMAVSDVFLVKSAATGLARGAWKTGSHTWTATSKWLVKKGYRKKYDGTHMNHALIPNGGWGKLVPDAIKNQPWNLRKVPEIVNYRLSGVMGQKQYEFFGERILRGGPVWLLPGSFSYLGRAFERTLDADQRGAEVKE